MNQINILKSTFTNISTMTKYIHHHKNNWESKNATMQFLGLFNDIDKYFDTLLDNPKFIPYNEKIKIIKESHLPVSHYIVQHEYLLKFFGEVRNHISHGIKIDGQSFTIPSEHAIKRISRCRDIIVTPPQAKEFFKKQVASCYADELCKDIFPKVLEHTHMPVYNKWLLVGILNQRLIAQRFISNIESIEKKTWKKLQVQDLPIQKQLNQYKFITPETDIHEILDYFIEAKNNKGEISSLFITNDGTPNNSLIGIITSWDLAIIEDRFQHKVVN